MKKYFIIFFIGLCFNTLANDSTIVDTVTTVEPSLVDKLAETLKNGYIDTATYNEVLTKIESVEETVKEVVPINSNEDFKTLVAVLWALLTGFITMITTQLSKVNIFKGLIEQYNKRKQKILNFSLVGLVGFVVAAGFTFWKGDWKPVSLLIDWLFNSGGAVVIYNLIKVFAPNILGKNN